jgi:predicted PurR-regulated permease PerM
LTELLRVKYAQNKGKRSLFINVTMALPRLVAWDSCGDLLRVSGPTSLPPRVPKRSKWQDRRIIPVQETFNRRWPSENNQYLQPLANYEKARHSVGVWKGVEPLAPSDAGQGTQFQESGPTIGRRHAYYFLLALLFLALLGVFTIVKPYLHSILLGAILALVFRPVHLRIEGVVKGRKNLAAFLSSVLLTAFVVVPVATMLVIAIRQGSYSVEAISSWIEAGNAQRLLTMPFAKNLVEVINRLESSIKTVLPSFEMTQIHESLLWVIQSIAHELSEYGGYVATNFPFLVGKFFIVIFVFFFIVRDEQKIFETVLHLLPLKRTHANELIDRIRIVARSALVGSLLTGIAHGVTGGFAFWIAGMPALFWGMVMVFASFVPILGTLLVIVPGVMYLFISGNYWQGTFVLIWCGIASSLIDTFLRPLLMKETSNTSTLLIFLAILGGITRFGLLGLLYGPLILGVALVLLYIYALEMRPLLENECR